MDGNAEIVTWLKAASTLRQWSDGSSYLSLLPDATALLAIEAKIGLRQVEFAALEAGIVPERYVRNHSALSIGEQRALLGSRVCLVGLGGLGSTVLELLVRLGVGCILVADGDVLEPSNLNRQLLCTMEWLGRPKTAAAQARVQVVNPAVELVALEASLDAEILAELLPSVDVVVDALGDLRSKRMLAAAALLAARPLVTAAVAGWHGYVATVRPGQRLPGKLVSDPVSGVVADQVLGCLAPAVTLAASLQAAAVVSLLTNRILTPSAGWPEVVEVLLFDVLDGSLSRILQEA